MKRPHGYNRLLRHPTLPKGFNLVALATGPILSSGPAFIERWHLHTEELAGMKQPQLKLEVYAVRSAAINVQLQLTP